jgi:hypothetical protein
MECCGATVAVCAFADPAAPRVTAVAPAKARPQIVTPIRREIVMEATSFGRLMRTKPSVAPVSHDVRIAGDLFHYDIVNLTETTPP